MKRYGVMFTCLCSRDIHTEVAQSLETDSFILSLRRFIGIRGNIHLMRFDNGTNFVGAIKALRKAFQEMDHNQISQYLQRRGAEALHTLLIEVEAIVNSRPMITETINEAQSHVPLSPSNLPTMKSKVVMLPPGNFGLADAYCRKRWRRTQHIVNEYWARWHKEFIQTLQERKPYRSKRRNFQKGDIVLLKADYNRNNWPFARIIETFPDKHGIMRTIKLRLGDAVGAEQRELVQPITKIVLLVEGDSPTESKKNISG